MMGSTRLSCLAACAIAFCIAGCGSLAKHLEDDAESGAASSSHQLEGLWVSPFEHTEIGPMFGDVRIWSDHTFEMRVYGRDAANNAWSAGDVVLAGRIDMDEGRFVPRNAPDTGDEWWLQVVDDNTLLVIHRAEGTVEKTELRRLPSRNAGGG